MKIEFTEDIDLALRKTFGGRITKRRRFKCGEIHYVEFTGEDTDAETIDFRFEDGLLALGVGRFAVAIQNEAPEIVNQCCPRNASRNTIGLRPISARRAPRLPSSRVKLGIQAAVRFSKRRFRP
jgi:hypothetical protein